MACPASNVTAEYTSCAAYCIHRIEDQLGLSKHTIEEIEGSFDPPGDAGNVSLLAVKNYLERTHGLETFAGDIALPRFNAYFNTALAIVHSRGAGETGRSHYLVLDKSQNTYRVLDPFKRPSLLVTTSSPDVLAKMAEQYTLTGAVLVVSDSPIRLERPGFSPTFSLALGMAALLTCCAALWRRRKS